MRSRRCVWAGGDGRRAGRWGGTGALRYTVPLTVVISGTLVLLVVSCAQVIEAHPDGGGAYAVAKRNLGRWPSLLTAPHWSSTTC